MNDHLYTDNDGLRLITQFEGAPRLKARLCEGGAWELSYGVTFDLDGSPFTAESTCTEDYAMALFRNALKLFEDAVKRLVTVPLNSHQFSALVALCYNIGEAQFAKSTVLRETNLNRFDDAAAAFGMWVYATRDGHTQAYRGLLRRRYAEAACFLGYDWTEACEDDAIALKREPPAVLPGRDRVIYKTPFKDVLAVAQRYPLAQPADTLILTPDMTKAPAQPGAKGGAAPAIPNPVGAAKSPHVKEPAKIEPDAAVVSKIPPKVNTTPAGASGPSPASPVGPAAPVIPAPQQQAQPVPIPKRPDPPVPVGQQTSAVDGARRSEEWSANTKAMWQSRRFYGLVLIMIGRLWMLKTGSNAFLNQVSDPLVMEMVGGFGVMIAGEVIQAWGQKKATKALR